MQNLNQAIGHNLDRGGHSRLERGVCSTLDRKHDGVGFHARTKPALRIRHGADLLHPGMQQHARQCVECRHRLLSDRHLIDHRLWNTHANIPCAEIRKRKNRLAIIDRGSFFDALIGSAAPAAFRIKDLPGKIGIDGGVFKLLFASYELVLLNL